RTDVDVGVAYGSPTEEVRRLIEVALTEEDLVLKRPKWDVLFMEFGDNSLLFRAFFWIRVDGFLDRDRVGSAVRFRIDALFREAGIEISFPQRDVHLDTMRPLEVKLLDRP
ncbi:MAG: mechanosensitive ion channel protein, partial [Acidobacteriota bacterium]